MAGDGLTMMTLQRNSPHTTSPVAQPKVLRAAVVGTGKISEEHCASSRLTPARRSSAFCDLSPSLAKYAVDRFAAGGAYTDAATMFREAKPDVVHILTPPHTHVALVTEALDAGAHVVVEKPVAPTNADFRKLHEHARSRGLRIVEDHNYRFNEPILAMEKLFADGTLGEHREVEVRMALPIRKAGGAIRRRRPARTRATTCRPACCTSSSRTVLPHAPLPPRRGRPHRGRLVEARVGGAVQVRRPGRAGDCGAGAWSDSVHEPRVAGLLRGDGAREQGLGGDGPVPARTCARTCRGPAGRSFRRW
jgi:hypothetical protein